MGWLVLGVWLGAVLLAVVLLGFCAYELSWKARRLRRDLDAMSQLADNLESLQSELAGARDRLAASAAGIAGAGSR